jgi:hypothetical protein
MLLTGENLSVWKRTVTLQVRPPQTPDGPTWHRARVSGVKDRPYAFTTPSQRKIMSTVQARLCNSKPYFYEWSLKN